jgi:hypothetical protein
VGLYLVVSLSYDVAAIVAQRRKGLTSTEVAEAVLERLWPSRSRKAEPSRAGDGER